jgi:inner membrane protein
MLVLVLVLDFASDAVSPSTTEFGVIDEPAHLATCLVLLLSLAAVARRRSPLAFAGAAVVASVAIDLDHVPSYLGWHGLSSGVPRPDPHSLLTPAVLILIGVLASGRSRQLALGAAFGVSAHLFRDLATGPGVALFWPLSTATVAPPYVIFPIGLAIAASTVVLVGWRMTRRAGGMVAGGRPRGVPLGRGARDTDPEVPPVVP